MDQRDFARAEPTVASDRMSDPIRTLTLADEFVVRAHARFGRQGLVAPYRRVLGHSKKVGASKLYRRMVAAPRPKRTDASPTT